MSAPSPHMGWRVGLGASLVLGLLPLISGLHSARLFFTRQAGTSEEQQLEELRLPWTQPQFLEMVATLERLLPPEAALVCTPVGGDDRTGKSRWFLFLADALYPRRVFVRQPRFASGTLMDYPRWVDYHFEVLDTDGGGQALGAALRREAEQRTADEALAERGVEWELEFRLDAKEPFAGARLLHLGEVVELRGTAVEAQL